LARIFIPLSPKKSPTRSFLFPPPFRTISICGLIILANDQNLVFILSGRNHLRGWFDFLSRFLTVSGKWSSSVSNSRSSCRRVCPISSFLDCMLTRCAPFSDFERSNFEFHWLGVLRPPLYLLGFLPQQNHVSRRSSPLFLVSWSVFSPP